MYVYTRAYTNKGLERCGEKLANAIMIDSPSKYTSIGVILSTRSFYIWLPCCFLDIYKPYLISP